MPKVLHKVGGLPMLGHVLRGGRGRRRDRDAVVVGPDADAVRAFVGEGRAGRDDPRAERAARHGACGARARKRRFANGADDVLVLYGDTPLVTAEDARPRCARRWPSGADVVVLGFRPADPTGYGRLIVEKGQLVAIREEKDASAEREARSASAMPASWRFRGDGRCRRS